MSVADLCAEIERRRLEALERKAGAYPRNNPIASDLGPCAREMALSILHWQERPAFPPDLQARFARGNLIEDAVLRELSELGFTVRVERRPFEIKNKKGRLLLRGRIDGFVEFAGRDYPMEVKSLDPNVYRRIATVEDFDKFGFMAKYPRQLQSYCYAENKEAGFFLLDDCMGHWKLIPVALDYQMVERILRQCETAVDAVTAIRECAPEETALPAYHEDPAVCRRCWAFGRLCTPPAEYHGLALATDPEFEAILDRRGEVEASHREYEALDKAVKERVTGKDGLVVGNWLIQGKEIARKGYEVKPSTYWQSKIVAITATDPA